MRIGTLTSALRRLAVVPIVLAMLVAVDGLLFGTGWFWRWPISFGQGLGAWTWFQVYETARDLETFSSAMRPSIVVGDSAIVFGVDEDAVNEHLAQQRVPTTSLVLGINGASASDSAIVAWAARETEPWLVIVGLGVRDFRDPGQATTPPLRMFYDSSADLPHADELGVTRLDAVYVRRFWKLYRYRAFVSAALQHQLAGPDDRTAVDDTDRVAKSPLSKRGQALFSPERITQEAFHTWRGWQRSQRFEDYLAWLRAKGAEDLLAVYRANVKGGRDPERAVHLRSVVWLMERFRERDARVVVVNTPENPLFRTPDARPYFDAALSDRYAGALARLAGVYGARFVDLRGFLRAEDFEDLVHANRVGERKLSARIASIIAEEWRARHGDGATVRRESEPS